MNLNPLHMATQVLGGASKALGGAMESLQNVGDFMGKMMKMPPDIIGAMKELGDICKSMAKCMEGVMGMGGGGGGGGIPGLQMNPLQMLGGGGGGGGGGPLGSVMDALNAPIKMLQDTAQGLQGMASGMNMMNMGMQMFNQGAARLA